MASVKERILETLKQHPAETFDGPKLGSMIGVNSSTMRKNLARLRDEGLVEVQKSSANGLTYLYKHKSQEAVEVQVEVPITEAASTA